MNIFKTLSLSLVLLTLTITTHAQDCGDGPGLPGADPDAPTNACPLDTWVIVLVVIALAFTTYTLHQRQKAQKAL